MNLIRPSYEIIEQGPGIQGIYDIIEDAGKTSYKSKVEGGEVAKKFVETRAKEHHGAVLEFGTVYLKFSTSEINEEDFYNKKHIVKFYRENRFSVVKEEDEYKEINSRTSYVISTYYITTNYRVIVENHREEDLKYLCTVPEAGHEKRICVRFTIDRFTGEEFLRHRVFSFCRESSRYCNYSKEKFGRNITYIIPPWIKREELAEGTNVSWWDGDWVDMDKMSIVCYGKDHTRVNTWLSGLNNAENTYMSLTNDWSHIPDTPEEDHKAWVAQQARTVLPCAIKSPLAMCGFAHDWIHFFDLRVMGVTGAPHPQAFELAEPLMAEFIKRGYLKLTVLEDGTTFLEVV